MKPLPLKDVQNEPDYRNLPIDKVGVKDIRYPVTVLTRDHGEQHTVARVNMYVDLPHQFRGTHMSRFIEILNRFGKSISTRNTGEIVSHMKEALESDTAHFEIDFPYFLTRKAPVSGAQSMMEYQCRLSASSSDDYYQLSVTVPVMSLCPCSKEISQYGAHNQRSWITILVRAREIVWIEDLVEVAVKSASSEIYALLKREDEKYVTEKAYENPVFVEDMVRNAAEQLNTMKNIIWYSVESENMESIHNHSAYACLSRNLEKNSN